MDNTVWELTESVETDATLEFVWNYWTNVANWDDPPAKFELDGPFAAGLSGHPKPANEGHLKTGQR
jgi:hypothetical protein